MGQGQRACKRCGNFMLVNADETACIGCGHREYEDLGLSIAAAAALTATREQQAAAGKAYRGGRHVVSG